jgi:hypothetical protein
MEGSLPRRALALVRQWCVGRGPELEDDWASAQALLSLNHTPGADND